MEALPLRGVGDHALGFLWRPAHVRVSARAMMLQGQRGKRWRAEVGQESIDPLFAAAVPLSIMLDTLDLMPREWLLGEAKRKRKLKRKRDGE